MNLKKDYTIEIIRAASFIIQQVRSGRSVKTAVQQSYGSYGYAITLNAQRAIKRNLKI